MRSTFSIISLAVAVSACGNGGISDSPAQPPDTDDPAFVVHLKQWHLVGDGVTPDDASVEVVVDAPAGTESVDLWIESLKGVRLARGATANEFVATVDLSSLAVGTYPFVMAANGSDTGFTSAAIKRSAPYYVFVTTDWDFSDPSDQAMTYQDMMHAAHPGMHITHFVGPYTFTDPVVTADRANAIATWVKQQQATFGDEIGLHIHPYCNFVVDAGMACITDQSTVYAAGDTSGYTIKLSAYGRTGLGTLLDHADALFTAHGLPHPKSFRAGGWTATIETLQALDDKGYVVDTSALNWAKIVSWKNIGNGVLYAWNMMHWAPIGDTSQPYHPNETDILQPGALGLLEVPDNGAMIDYTTTPQITQIFNENFPDGLPLAKSTTMMMGFHPSKDFSAAEFTRVQDFLSLADKHLATADLGPVVYINLSDVLPAFPRQ